MQHPPESGTIPPTPPSVEIRGSSDQPVRTGFWYALLLPVSVLYFRIASELADNMPSSGPNVAGGLIPFLLMCLAWPLVAIFVLAVIRGVLNIRGVLSLLLGIIMWLASCVVPFVLESWFVSQSTR